MTMDFKGYDNFTKAELQNEYKETFGIEIEVIN
jgi:hypothetical protein